MIVLVTGSTGFIGRHLVAALQAAGYTPLCMLRNPAGLARLPAGSRVLRLEFERLQSAEAWRAALQGVDAAINCVGILRQGRGQSFETLHERVPQALFRACAEAGVRRIVQVSALGAEAQALSAYHRSKWRADQALLMGPVPAIVVQPSLIYGAGGTSAGLLTRLASLPLTPLPGRGEQQLQPIHIDDVVAAILHLLPTAQQGRIALVGPAPLSLVMLLQVLRTSMGLGPLRALPIPMPLMRAIAAVGQRWPGSLLDRETLQMLQLGNVADAAPLRQLLQRPLRAPPAFIDAPQRAAVADAALLSWLLPLLRYSLAAVWIVTALLSAGLYPVAESYALLARVGLDGPRLAPIALYGAAALNLLLGLALLAPRRLPGLYALQAATILGYTLLISLFLPEYWRHPYGPILKNLPLLAAILLLSQLDRRPRWTMCG